MSSKTILLQDSHIIKDNLVIGHRMNGGPTKTRIQIIDRRTGKVLQEIENKTLIPGSQMTACKQFGLDPIVPFPTYNSVLELENSHPDYEVDPMNEPITCLWCAGRSGFVKSPNEVLVVSNTDRVEPINDLIPFRYVTPDTDLDVDQRQVYFGRHVNPVNERISYYFKAFDTRPQLHVRYLDGTEITANMYNIDSSQIGEVYVEMRLAVNRLDFRSYFDQVLGWENATISTVSLLTGWYDRTICENPDAEEIDQIYYRWYQDILPFSKFNFKEEELTDLDRAIDFNYQVFY